MGVSIFSGTAFLSLTLNVFNHFIFVFCYNYYKIRQFTNDIAEICRVFSPKLSRGDNH